MKPYYEQDGITIYNADARDAIASMPDAGLVLTDPPYSTGRAEAEFAATGNIAVILHEASKRTESMAVFGTSSGRGIEFMRSAIRHLNHCRVLAWHRRFVNSPAAGPWRWDLVLIHVFGKGAFGRPVESSLIQTDGTRSLAVETGHRSPVPTQVMEWIAEPFEGLILDPFCGAGASLLAAQALGRPAIGIEIDERYCEIAADRLRSQLFAVRDDSDPQMSGSA